MNWFATLMEAGMRDPNPMATLRAYLEEELGLTGAHLAYAVYMAGFGAGLRCQEIYQRFVIHMLRRGMIVVTDDAGCRYAMERYSDDACARAGFLLGYHFHPGGSPRCSSSN